MGLKRESDAELIPEGEILFFFSCLLSPCTGRSEVRFGHKPASVLLKGTLQGGLMHDMGGGGRAFKAHSAFSVTELSHSL